MSPWRAKHSGPAMAEPLWLEWLALGGLLVFGTWLLGVRGVWALLLHADPTGLTLIIVAVFACSTVWCGSRAKTLQAQRQALEASLRPGSSGQGWAHEYWQASRAPGGDGRSLGLHGRGVEEEVAETVLDRMEEVRLVDDLGRAQLLLDVEDAPLDHRLLVLGVVVLGVLRDVAELAGLLDPLGHLATLDRGQVLELLLELLEPVVGEDDVLGHGRRRPFAVGWRAGTVPTDGRRADRGSWSVGRRRPA